MTYVDQMYGVFYNEQVLYHHGVLGQRWGVRRYQNADGSLTKAGKLHQAKQNYKSAKKSAFERALRREDVIETELDNKLSANYDNEKAGKISGRKSSKNAHKLIKQYSPKYQESNDIYKSEKKSAKAQYHKERADIFDAESKAHSGDKYRSRVISNKNKAKSYMERTKADIADAESKGYDKIAAQGRRKLAGLTIMKRSLGEANTGSYLRYKEQGQSTVKAFAKMYFTGQAVKF